MLKRKPVKLQSVNTLSAMEDEEVWKQLMVNINRGLPRLHQLLEFKQYKGHNRPIALVGGGTSLKTTLEELRRFQDIMVVGSSHDYIIANGIIPKYAAICDPQQISSYYIKNPQKGTNYLVASCCHAAVFDALKGHMIHLWHCHSDDKYIAKLREMEGEKYEGVGGGCTIGLRALSIAIMLGYSNIHFFGYDSCLDSSNQSYAYDIDSRDNMLDLLGNVYTIQIGAHEPGEKKYNCLGYQIGQAQHFKEFYNHFRMLFIPTFHGEGLLADMYKAGI